MAIALSIGDVLQARLEYKGPDNTVAYNIVHYRLANATPIGTGVPPFNDVDMAVAGPAIADAIGGLVVEEWTLAASNQCSMTGVTVQNIWPTPKSRQYHYVFAAPQAGTIVSEALPLQDAPVLVKRTAFGQRWGIGRVFCVGTPETGQAGGLLTVGQVDLWNDFGEQLGEGFGVAVPSYSLILVPTLPSFQADGTPRKLNIDEVVLTDNIIKTQRRRRPGKGI